MRQGLLGTGFVLFILSIVLGSAAMLVVEAGWLVAFTLPFEIPTPTSEGCSPGFWNQEQHFDQWSQPYDPSDLFSGHFEDAFPGMTLLEVLDQGGGGLNALGRHTVAALLNAAHSGVNYAFSEQEVIDMFNGVFPGTDGVYEILKNQFEAQNIKYCPL